MPDPLPVPAFVPGGGGQLRYYTPSEFARIGLTLRGVSGEGDHVLEDLSPSGSGCTRRYFCNWEYRYAAACVLVGATAQYTSPASGLLAISRLLPDTYDGTLNMVWGCSKVKLSPFKFTGETDSVDFGQPIPQFELCSIEATYEELPFALLDDAEEEVEPTGERSRYTVYPGYPGADVSAETNYLTLPGGSLNYTTVSGSGVPTGVPIPYSIGKSESVIMKPYVWKRVPFETWGAGTPLYTMVYGDGTPANTGYISALNLTTFDEYPPLTMQLRGVEEKLLPDPIGIGYSWDLTFKFAIAPRPYGWLGLYFADPNNGALNAYYQVLRYGAATTQTPAFIAANDGIALFNVREFANLWNPDGA